MDKFNIAVFGGGLTTKPLYILREKGMHKRYNLKIEIITLTILFLSMIFTDFNQTFYVNLVLYVLLSVAFYLATSPKIVLKKTKNTSGLGEREIISDDQKIMFYEKGIFYSSLVKLTIILFMVLTVQSGVFLKLIPVIKVTSIIILVVISILLLSVSNSCFLKAKGFVKAKISNSLIYNNQNDARAMIDKRVGIGSEINFGSKQGRLVFWVLLALPITFIGLLLLVFSLAGKI